MALLECNSVHKKFTPFCVLIPDSTPQWRGLAAALNGIMWKITPPLKVY